MARKRVFPRVLHPISIRRPVSGQAMRSLGCASLPQRMRNKMETRENAHHITTNQLASLAAGVEWGGGGRAKMENRLGLKEKGMGHIDDGVLSLAFSEG